LQTNTKERRDFHETCSIHTCDGPCADNAHIMGCATDEDSGTLPVIIEEEIWLVFMDEPAGYFQDARQDFLNGDLQDAAHNIRKGAALVKLETHRAKKEVNKALKTSANELEKLAKAVEKGSIATGGRLEEAFTRAEHALAQHHYQKALDYEAKGENEKMAYAIEAAATHLLSALFWADEDLEEGEVVAIKEGRSLAKKTIQGATWVPKQVREATISIGRGIQKLGKKLKPAREKPDL